MYNLLVLWYVFKSVVMELWLISTYIMSILSLPYFASKCILKYLWNTNAIDTTCNNELMDKTVLIVL